MDLKFHFIASTILALFLYPFFGPISFIALIGGWLIDVDHYLYNIVKHRSFNIKKSYRYYKKGKARFSFCLHIFHTVEFWLFMLALSFLSNIFLIFFLGMMLHMTMDFFDAWRKNFKLTKVRATSILEWLFKKDDIVYQKDINPPQNS